MNPGVVATVLACLGVFALLTLAVLVGGPLDSFDRAIAAAVQAVRASHGDSFAVLSTMSGDSAFVWLAGAAMGVMLLLFGERRFALLATLALLVAKLGVPLMKLAVGRDRPAAAYAELHSFSFPSGHAAGASVLFGILALIVVRASARRTGGSRLDYRVLVCALAATAAMAVGASRVWLDMHWTSDVIAGHAFALALLLLLNAATSTRLDGSPADASGGAFTGSSRRLATASMAAVAIVYLGYALVHGDARRSMYADLRAASPIAHPQSSALDPALALAPCPGYSPAFSVSQRSPLAERAGKPFQ